MAKHCGQITERVLSLSLKCSLGNSPFFFSFVEGLKECGRDWEAIARRVITKTGAQCKNFYFNYKKKLQLELLVAEHESTKVFVFDRLVSSHRYLGRIPFKVRAIRVKIIS